MIRTVRAAGFAAVALTLAVSAVWGGPLQAGNGDIAPAGEHMRHASDERFAAGMEPVALTKENCQGCSTTSQIVSG